MSPSPSSLTTSERQVLFQQFLQCLDREENLIHYRMTWGLQWNIACFAALFAVLFASKNSALPVNFTPYVQIVIAFFGGAVSIFSLIGIQAAHKQTTFLIDTLNLRLGVKHHDWENTEFIRPYGDPASVHRSARRVSGFLPILFIFLWFLVFLYAYPGIISPGH
jgi:hypothetical protein